MKIYCKKGISSFLAFVMIMSLFVGFPQVAHATSTWNWTPVSGSYQWTGFQNPLSSASDMAIDSTGKLVVAEPARTGLCVLDSGYWYPSYFTIPNGITSATNLLMSSTGANFTQFVIDSGKLKTNNGGTWVVDTRFPGSQNAIGLVKDRAGDVYSICKDDGHLYKFSSGAWTQVHGIGAADYLGGNDLSYALDFAFDSKGDIYFVYASGINMYLNDPNNGWGGSIFPINFVNGTPGGTRIAIDSIDNIYVSDTTNNKVYMLTYLGNGMYDYQTIADQTIPSPRGIMIDSNGDFYIAGGSHIYKTSPPHETATAGNNQISLSASSTIIGNAVTITVTGDRQDEVGVNLRDERYIPVSWVSTETGKSGTFTMSSGSYTSDYTPTVAGNYTITATYQKQTWDGTNWNDVSGSTDTKSIAFQAKSGYSLSTDRTTLSYEQFATITSDAPSNYICAFSTDGINFSGMPLNNMVGQLPWIVFGRGSTGNITLTLRLYNEAYTNQHTVDPNKAYVDEVQITLLPDPEEFTSVSANPSSTRVGNTVTLTGVPYDMNASGATGNGSTIGEERYIPTTWEADDGEQGAFSLNNGSYTSTYTPTASGSQEVYVEFIKQIWDGNAWNDDSGTDFGQSTIVEVGYNLTADRTTVSKGQSVIFTTDAPAGNLAAFFLDGVYWGSGEVGDTPNPFPWSIIGRGRTQDVVATYRVYDQTFDENGTPPDYNTPYGKEVQVTFTLDPDAATTTADPANNSVGAFPDTMTIGNSTILTATGDRQSSTGSTIGEERYIPTTWESTETGMNGTFTKNTGSYGDTYTSSYTPLATGSYTITATFQKQTWDGSQWNDVSGVTDTKTTTLTVTAAISTYTVTYDLNGGSGTAPTDSNSYASGATVTLTSGSGLSKTGYTFGGWSLTQNGTAISGTTFSMPANNVTLYAVWTATGGGNTTYTVTYNTNGGAGTAPTDNNTYASGATVTLQSGSGLTKTNYTFGGWSLTQNGTAISGTTFSMPANNVTLYAVWTATGGGNTTYTVTYNTNGGAGTAPTDNNTYASGTTVTLKSGSGLTKTNYTFGGWSLTQNGTAISGTSFSMLANNVMLYAVWTATGGSGGSGNSGGSSGGGSSSGGNNSNGTATAGTSGVDVLVNGKAENAGTATTGTQGSQTVTTIVVDEKKLEQKMEAEGNNATITIPVNTKTDIVVGELNGQMVKDMEKKQDTLEVRTDNASYFIPAQQINIDSVSAQIGKTVELKDIKVQVEVAKSATDTVKVVENSAQKGSFTIVVSPMDFTVKGTYGGKTVDVSKFNVYVERLIAIPDGVDPNKITTGVITEPDGTSRHVPTEVTVINGKYYAKINSLTNSTYSVVWHPLEFKDVANHWAKTEVNDMGSRMVVTGVGNGLYEPDRDITRAEFAAIVVRALGFKPGEGSNSFTDVESGKWYCDYVKTATTYKIIEGYGNGKFGPMDKITREQAMTMIARAMNITGLKADLTSSEAEKLLAGFTDGNNAADYSKANIAACVKTGIVSGRGNNLVAPKDNITRAEVAAIVRMLLQKSNLI